MMNNVIFWADFPRAAFMVARIARTLSKGFLALIILGMNYRILSTLLESGMPPVLLVLVLVPVLLESTPDNCEKSLVSSQGPAEARAAPLILISLMAESLIASFYFCAVICLVLLMLF